MPQENASLQKQALTYNDLKLFFTSLPESNEILLKDSEESRVTYGSWNDYIKTCKEMYNAFIHLEKESTGLPSIDEIREAAKLVQDTYFDFLTRAKIPASDLNKHVVSFLKSFTAMLQAEKYSSDLQFLRLKRICDKVFIADTWVSFLDFLVKLDEKDFPLHGDFLKIYVDKIYADYQNQSDKKINKYVTDLYHVFLSKITAKDFSQHIKDTYLPKISPIKKTGSLKAYCEIIAELYKGLDDNERILLLKEISSVEEKKEILYAYLTGENDECSANDFARYFQLLPKEESSDNATESAERVVINTKNQKIREENISSLVTLFNKISDKNKMHFVATLTSPQQVEEILYKIFKASQKLEGYTDEIIGAYLKAVDPSSSNDVEHLREIYSYLTGGRKLKFLENLDQKLDKVAKCKFFYEYLLSNPLCAERSDFRKYLSIEEHFSNILGIYTRLPSDKKLVFIEEYFQCSDPAHLSILYDAIDDKGEQEKFIEFLVNGKNRDEFLDNFSKFPRAVLLEKYFDIAPSKKREIVGNELASAYNNQHMSDAGKKVFKDFLDEKIKVLKLQSAVTDKDQLIIGDYFKTLNNVPINQDYFNLARLLSKEVVRKDLLESGPDYIKHFLAWESYFANVNTEHSKILSNGNYELWHPIFSYYANKKEDDKAIEIASALLRQFKDPHYFSGNNAVQKLLTDTETLNNQKLSELRCYWQIRISNNNDKNDAYKKALKDYPEVFLGMDNKSLLGLINNNEQNSPRPFNKKQIDNLLKIIDERKIIKQINESVQREIIEAMIASKVVVEEKASELISKDLSNILSNASKDAKLFPYVLNILNASSCHYQDNEQIKNLKKECYKNRYPKFWRWFYFIDAIKQVITKREKKGVEATSVSIEPDLTYGTQSVSPVKKLDRAKVPVQDKLTESAIFKAGKSEQPPLQEKSLVDVLSEHLKF